MTSSMIAQKSELDSLYQEMIVQLPIEDIYGQYQKPASLIKLESVIKTRKIDTETIGFFLYESKPYMPAPTDIIPFATTGGDGCYFAFLTDYGYYKNLEEAPIVFISPTDFDEKYPNQANKLFARNFRDFLKIMITMQYAEIVRFKELTKMDFDSEIQIMQADINSNSSEERIKLREQTIETIKREYNIDKINNLHGYYSMLESERKQENYIDLKDGLGLKTQLNDRLIGIDFSEKSLLSESLENASKIERIRFYREAPFIYKHYTDEYQEIVRLIAEYLYLDGFHREAKILKFEIEQNLKSKNYFEARKKMLEKEKNKNR